MRKNITQSEQKAIDEIVRDLPADQAARMRNRLVDENVLVFGDNPAMQKNIQAFYEARSARLRQKEAGKPLCLPPRTSDNSWTPGKEEQLLINSLLNALPESNRARVREMFLRTDGRILSKEGDPEANAIIEKIYELRHKRMKELQANKFKQR